MAYGANQLGWEVNARYAAEERVRAVLWQFAAERRPSVRALKLTGSCFHPSRVG